MPKFAYDTDHPLFSQCSVQPDTTGP